MKTLFFSSLLSISLLVASCSTLKDKLSLSDAPLLIDAVVPSLVQIGVKKQPKTVPYLETLVTVIDNFALGGDLSPEALQAAIATIKVKELQTPEALAVVNSAVGLYKAYYGAAVTNKIATVENLVPILTAISDSIKAGLSK